MPGYELLPDQPPAGLVRRFFVIQRHLAGLAFGSLNVYVREHRVPATRRFRLFYRLAAPLAWIMLLLALIQFIPA